MQTVPGVKTVFAGQPRLIAEAYPAVVVHLPGSDETAPTMPRGVGRKKIEYRARLDVITIDPAKNAVVSELAFDDLVDGICEAIRQNYTLGGSVHSAGTEYIRTAFAEPRLAGEDQGSIFRLATIEFDVCEYVVG